MKTWTDSAEERLESHLRDRVAREQLDAEEAAEVVEDWRLHVQEEAERQPGEVVNLEMLELVLGRLGQSEEGAQATTSPPAKQTESRASESPREPLRQSSHPWIWAFGVAFPAIIILFETIVGFCEAVFFDPIPTWMHLVVIGAVPAGNAWLLLRLESGRIHRLLPQVAGFTVIVSAFYALLFVPLIPASVLALIVIGLGLLSLMPILAWTSSWRASRHVRDRFGRQLKWKRGWGSGAALGALALVALEAGPLATRIGLTKALSEDPERSAEGVAQLRAFHVRSTLLRACYEGNRGTTMATDISGWLTRGWQVPLQMLGSGVLVDHDSEAARDLFYRVTGTPFNTLQPPTWVTGNQWKSRGAGWDEVEFDSHLGGDQVAVRLSGLHMSQSRIDAHLDGPSNLGYLEWTSEFTNRSPRQREARFQVMLPEAGVISRVTLWVNGEPREAAFASKSRVKAAYQEVAVQQRRDPILVTACGPGRAMVQCFPVPPNGGTMKIRLGMTAPLRDGRLALPVILEQNFAMAKNLEHAVWMQSAQEFTWAAQETPALRDGAGFSLQQSIKAHRLVEDRWFARLADPSSAERVWCEDQFAEVGERHLTRTLETVPRPAPKRCVVVLDGSVGLQKHRAELASALEASSGHDSLSILLATDAWREIEAREVRTLEFSGGRDNIPALAEALQRARGEGGSAVIWIHAAQPLRGPSRARLRQMLERSAQEVALYSVAVAPGGNRILEDLFQFRAVRMGPRQVMEAGRLERWLDDFLSEGTRQEARWSRLAAVDREAKGRKVWDQLARWWAAEQVQHMRRVQVNDPTQIALAAKYQLVTAYSGAVVLETDDQYRRHGLQAVDAAAAPEVPGVPEPSVPMLLGPAALIALWRRRRGKD